MSILGEREITRERAAGGTWSAGRWTATAPATSDTILGSVQPPTGDELQRLPEGDRKVERRVVFTTSELRTANQHGQAPADIVVIDGVRYQVEQVDRHIAVLPHYRAVVARIPEAA